MHCFIFYKASVSENALNWVKSTISDSICIFRHPQGVNFASAMLSTEQRREDGDAGGDFRFVHEGEVESHGVATFSRWVEE